MTSISRRTLLLSSAFLLVPASLRAAAPRRIVSVGGAVTEILYRLGREGEIVGVDATSQYPADALKTKPNVGYVRALGAEGILSLNPTMVIAIEGAGPPDAVRLVEQAGVPVVRVDDEPSPEGIVRRIRDVAEAVDAIEPGEVLVREVESGFAQLNRNRAQADRPVKALFVLSLQNGRPLVGGKGTTADAMLALAGAENAASSLEGWKPLSDEGVIAAAPEAIVMMEHGPGGRAQDPFGLPAFASTPAAAEHRLIVMDGLYLLGFGPRTPLAAQDLLAALHPELPEGARRIAQP
ncbi:MAG TPA: hemin ABC transporter substrate-binding protein [Microvirga sp.]|nr:hemin ABC transporter substrate-binding protein [Microvirga sp.]